MCFLKLISEKKHGRNSFQSLRLGEAVRIRSERDILSTLDEYGTLEGLPFMPEMRKFCGQRFRVLKRVEKLIIEGDGMRHMKGTVILDGAACDGEAHEGCRRTCLLLWKEPWLERLKNNDLEGQQAMKTSDSCGLNESQNAFCGCQSINMFKATSPFRAWDIRRYTWDIKLGMYKPLEYPFAISTRLSLAVQRIIRVHTRKPRRTPSQTLNLQPGELVEVKRKEEILATLDARGKNRGLEFIPEMLKYCGGKYRVLKRLDRMMNERTGKVREIANTVILDGVSCDGKIRGCQRSCYCLWREIWLRRAQL